MKSLGQADNLELCNELCCRNETFSVGLFDGIKCYGIKCIGDKDRRCNLLRDGNADYTIFKILRPFFQRSDQIAVKKKKKRRRRKRRKNIRKIKMHLLWDFQVTRKVAEGTPPCFTIK